MSELKEDEVDVVVNDVLDDLLPDVLLLVIMEYLGPSSRSNWRTIPSPGAIAMYRSDLYRDYRTDSGYSLYGGRPPLLPMYEVETWKEWLFWKCMLKVECHEQDNSRPWRTEYDRRIYSQSDYPVGIYSQIDDLPWDYDLFIKGMEEDYWKRTGSWRNMVEFVDVEKEKWLRW